MTNLLRRSLGFIAAVLFLVAALVLANSAHAQSCNPSTPRTDTGAGFAPFGAAEQVLARGGNSGPAWEWAVGTDTEAGQKVQGSLDWVSGKEYAWAITYSGAGGATLEIRDQGTLVLSLSYASGMDAGNALRMHVGTNASIGSGTTIAATVTSISGNTVSGSISQTGNNQDSGQNQYWFYPPMTGGFTAQGTVSLTYASLPTGSRVQFVLQAGTIACGGGNNPPTVSITAPANNALYNAPANITVSANAADSDGTVAQVQFLANGNPIGTATASPYTINWTNVAAGSYSLTAVATDNLGATTTSTAVAVTVNALPTVSITAPANNAVVQAPGSVTVTASAADSDGTIAKVDFYQGATLIGTATSAPYSFNWTGVAAGTYSLTAVATDNNNAIATSGAISIKVNSAPTVSITAPANNAVYQAPGSITLTASAADSDGTITQVQFFNGATSIGAATSAPYTVNWTGVAAGTYSVTAVATDSNNGTTTSAAISVKVNAAPSVTLTSPANGASFNAPATINLAATASDSDGSIAKVEFFQGATLVATVTAAPYTFTLNNVAAGSYSFTAVATDSDGGTTSAAAAVTVNAPPTVSITAPANNAVYQAPGSVTITASAADSDGTVTKVDFYQGATLIGAATTAPYSFNWTNVAAGTYSLTAVATDNNNGTTTSAAISIKVNGAPTVSITAPANNAVYQAPGSITLTATAADADGTITQVEFFNGATSLGVAMTAPYTVNWTSVPAGTYSVTAVATDNNNGTTTSAAISVKVNAAPTISLTSPTNGATFTAPATINLAATASDTDGTIAQVAFYNGATLIATVTSAPYTYAWTNVAQGTYVITAKATDNDGGITTSAAATITVSAAVGQLYFIHPDHLNTPRLIADATQKTIWKWDQQEPFGNNTPNEDPDGDSITFSFPLRYPGQYFDTETNLAYNMMRDYDPGIGRYAESDPIGLRGGLNTYGYVGGNPVQFSDPRGLDNPGMGQYDAPWGRRAVPPGMYWEPSENMFLPNVPTVPAAEPVQQPPSTQNWIQQIPQSPAPSQGIGPMIPRIITGVNPWTPRAPVTVPTASSPRANYCPSK